MKYLTIAAMMITSFGLSGNAMAENGHSYNGSYCKAYNGNQNSFFTHRSNGIRNNSSSTRSIACPVIVDELAKKTGTTRVWLYYTGSGTVSCTLYNRNGNSVLRQSRSRSRVNTGWFRIPNLTSDSFWGTYSMVCSIPSGGTLNTIWVGEQN